jgi:hypothetical protein
MFKLKVYHTNQCSHIYIFFFTILLLVLFFCSYWLWIIHLFLSEVSICDSECHQRKRENSGSTRDHFLANEILIQALPDHNFLSSVVKESFFGACLEVQGSLLYNGKEEGRKNEMYLERCLDSSSDIILIVVQLQISQFIYWNLRVFFFYICKMKTS